MTQAHKTPGAFVRLHEWVFTNPVYEPFFRIYRGRVFEVLNGNFYPGHVKIRDIITNETLILHDDELVTVTKQEAKEIRSRKSKI